MRQALFRLLLLLFTVAFGISGAIWVGIRLGGWGLAVMVGVALGTMIAFLVAALGIQRADRVDPYAGVGLPWGRPAGSPLLYPGWIPGTSGVEGHPSGGGYGLPAGPGGGFPGRGSSGAPGLPFLGMPWISWVAWVPGPPVPDPHRGGWPLLPPPAPRTFTVIGEEEEE